MKVIKTKWYKHHGITIQEDTYDNNAVMMIPRPDIEEPPLPESDDLGEEEEREMEQAMNVQYLVDLAEIDMEE